MDVGEAAFDSIVVEAEAFVIESKDVENSGVKIVNGRDSFDGLVAKFIGGSVAERSFYSGAGQPGGEAAGIVIAAAGPFLEGGHASKFGTENDEGIFEQAS